MANVGLKDGPPVPNIANRRLNTLSASIFDPSVPSRPSRSSMSLFVSRFSDCWHDFVMPNSLVSLRPESYVEHKQKSSFSFYGDGPGSRTTTKYTNSTNEQHRNMTVENEKDRDAELDKFHKNYS